MATAETEGVAVKRDAMGATEHSTHGERWAEAFGMQEPATRAALRARYAFLKEKLVFRMDAQDIEDPLTAFAAIQQTEDEDDGSSVQIDETPLRNVTDKSSGWSQYLSDENLLQEINTDLDRLFPAGNEGFFQNERYLGALRQVLFVWCRLHPDVSYRQGMHDVAAVVFYALLPSRELKPARSEDESNGDHMDLFGKSDSEAAKSREEEPELPEYIEADTFSLFEAIMLYLKPFYEVVKTSYREKRLSHEDAEPRLFSSYSRSENDDPNHLFGGGPVDATRISESERTPEKKKSKPALHRLCFNVQYELLEQKDPQLFYHLQNLDIVPETYCLRWIRLLFAREFTFDALLHIWNGMIFDQTRPSIQYQSVLNEDDWMKHRPSLLIDQDDASDQSWIGFPLLRYVCVARLLTWSAQLLRADNTGCLRLLMRSFSIDDVEDLSDHVTSAINLVRFAQVLQNPLTEQVEGKDGVEVVEFGPGSLGIVLTAAKTPFANRLAVKDFVADSSAPNKQGQAEATGRVHIGDLLESINGFPISGFTTEEVKRHIQLIARPFFIAFRRCPTIEESSSGAKIPVSLLSPRKDASDSDGEALFDPLVSLFLPGEMCYANVETSMLKFSLAHDGSCLAHYISGKFYITNYRCIFTRLLSPGEIDWQVPVLSISSVDGMDAGLAMSNPSALDQAQAALGFSVHDTYCVVIRCKDAQVARLSFSNYSEYSKLYKCLTVLAFPASLLDAFCFTYSPTIPPSEVAPFDLRREYERIGLLDYPDRLRCIDQSPRYELCETYPQHLIVPTEMSDLKIKAAAAFRSHGRLPIVSWVHRANGATISRSSQPLVGLKSNRSAEDELLVRLICCSGNLNSFGRYLIMDARSQLAAVGNKAMGKGTEIPSNYRGAKLMFMNIDNIHTIRQSLQALTSVFEPRKGMSEESSSTSFYGKIESSGWLRHVRLVLKASCELAHSVHTGVSVLTHCSDGWDRTAQMVALAELMLDPYYRTLRGFQCLIEKEWCSFGHQFAARCGHARSDANNDQRSPVFLLWLDCVWQFLRQFPSECEFNENLLLALADHVYSCKYGTFMFDCERQRKEFFSKHRVYSIWSDINSYTERFINPLYTPTPALPILSPSTLSKNIKLWKGYFCRWDPTFIPPVPAMQYY
ncbi:hypothetical protein Poli38472_006408 [Pythium oligandrum]|uniref:Phosphatidylinositol-3-phosphatase n=1 Tax=Pythium oligandrum TaxID=41045 RepID=A0A8K1FF31_PYTOL|nr:hypothetical protein Poli38472_006408 [Pythium oligandrum]|eukprot:TMW56398.1 hypothetical protein Poli38472_006408 [Pythium oligandrum]